MSLENLPLTLKLPLGMVYGTSKDITGLTRGLTYTLAVRAQGSGNVWGSWSNNFQITLEDLTAPTTPSGLTAPTVTANSVSLAWNASTDTSGLITYDVYLNSGGTALYMGASALNTTSFIHSQFPGGSYIYTVRARDSFSNVSAASSSVSVNTPSASYTDNDGIPDHLEPVFGSGSPANPTTSEDSSIQLNIHKPHAP